MVRCSLELRSDDGDEKENLVAHINEKNITYGCIHMDRVQTSNYLQYFFFYDIVLCRKAKKYFMNK